MLRVNNKRSLPAERKRKEGYSLYKVGKRMKQVAEKPRIKCFGAGSLRHTRDVTTSI